MELSLAAAGELEARWSGSAGAPLWDTTFPGGRSVSVERGSAGEQLIRYADRATFLLSASADRLLCAATDADDPSWRRFLLDTVLWWAALANGLQVLHASSVDVDGRLAVLVSHAGGGKSTLAVELLRRGGSFFTDDVLSFTSADGEPIAHPGPPLMNLAASVDPPGGLVTELAQLEEGDSERWVRVERATRSPLRPAALFLYRRGPGLELGVTARAAGVLDLAPFAWGIPADLDVQRGRFLGAAALAELTPAFDLTAAQDSPPSAIAEAVEKILGDGR